MSRGWLLICTAGTLIIVVALMQVWIFSGGFDAGMDI
jgi:hypothetical protein